ncbi:hypothetical protein MCERE155_01032 [Candidatus Nanopelagicaceae bacterium]
MDSPLSSQVNSNFGGVKKSRSKIFLGIAVIAVVPFMLSTFAASVTVGNGSLEFGQGSQQAIACDKNVFIALGEEWHSQPVEGDGSAGFFRVRTATISNLDLTTCHGVKLRLRLIDGAGQEIVLGGDPSAKVLQMLLPDVAPGADSPAQSDSTELRLTYLNSLGVPITGALPATVSLNVSGTSVYDGSNLSPTSADVTFYLDSSATIVNIDGELVRRATVETVHN